MFTIDGELEEHLRLRHVAVTSFDALRIPFDVAQAEKVGVLAAKHAIIIPSDDVRREARVQPGECTELAKDMVRPVVEKLFPDGLSKGWFLFGVNYYQDGWTFPLHRDLNNPDIMTIVIASISGVRMLQVEGSGPIRLTPGSIALLDGQYNPTHRATCIKGPSVSIVADVPAALC